MKSHIAQITEPRKQSKTTNINLMCNLIMKIIMLSQFHTCVCFTCV